MGDSASFTSVAMMERLGEDAGVAVMERFGKFFGKMGWNCDV